MMEQSEFSAKLSAVKAEYEAETGVLRRKIDRARLAIAQAEKRLARVTSAYEDRISALSRSFLGLGSTVTGVSEPGRAGAKPKPPRRRQRRGAMDAPVLEFVRASLEGIEFTVQDATDAWNVLNATEPIRRSTMRGILGRLAERGYLEIVDEGMVGSANPRKYALAEEETMTNSA